MVVRRPKKQAPLFGQRLVAIRKCKGLSQACLAKLIGIKREMIDYYERRASNPTLDYIKRAASAKADPTNMLARQNFARTLASSGDLNAAVVESRTIIKLNPYDAFSHTTLAETLEKAGEKQESLNSLKEATTLTPTDAELLFNYAVALQKEVRFEEAADAFARYLKIAPENTNVAEIKQRIVKLRQWARGW